MNNLFRKIDSGILSLYTGTKNAIILVIIFAAGMTACTVISQSSTPVMETSTPQPNRMVVAPTDPSTPAPSSSVKPTIVSTQTITPTVAATQSVADELCSPDPGPFGTVTWFVPASPPLTQRLEGTNQDEYFRNAFLFWNDDNTLNLKTDCGDALLRLDPSTAKIINVATFTPTPSDGESRLPSSQVFSPNRTYFIQCNSDKSEMYRTKDQKLLGSIPEDVCRDPLTPELGSWANDESGYAYTGIDDHAILWPADGNPPIDLGPAYTVRWSQDSERLLSVTSFLDTQRDLEHINVIGIFNAKGRKLGQFQFPGRTMEYNILWYTNSVIDVRYWSVWFGYHHHFYEWASGKSLGEGNDNDIPPLFAQKISLSPDQNWQVSDVSDGDQVLSDSPSYHYTLADFRKKEVTDLAGGPNQQLQFLGWSQDSKIFYLVNRPASEKAVTFLEMPFGFLALDVASKRYTTLFEQAFFVEFNPDRNLAWVLFPAKRQNGVTGMDGAIFDLRAKTLTDRQPVADRVIYQNPAEGDLLPVAWSNDGTRLAYMTEQRQVVVLNREGKKMVLGSLPSSAPLAMSQLPPNWHRLLWSPNDRWLVVQSTTWFYILDLSSLEKK